MTGVGGTPHQIDVYCTGRDRMIIIECKDMSSNVQKKDIMDFAAKLTDLKDKATMGIFITTSDFASGAKAMSEHYGNIQLWNGNYIKKKLAKIPPDIPIIQVDEYKTISYNKTEKYITNHAKPSKLNPRYWFKKIETISTPFLRPLYIIYLKDGKCIIIDGNTGDIIRYRKNKLEYLIYRNFDSNEIELIKHLRSRFQKRNLKIPNMTKNNIQTGLDRLYNKRYIKIIKKRPITYNTKIPKNVLNMFNINYTSSVLPVFDYTNSNNNTKHDITFDIQDIKESLERLYNSTIDRYEIVYYPMYLSSINHNNKSIKKKYMDGITGNRLKI